MPINTSPASGLREPAIVTPYAAPRIDQEARVGGAVWELVRSMQRHRRLVVALPFLMIALLLLPSFIWGRDYSAESSFLPESNSPAAAQRFAGLAAQLGITLGAQTGSESLDAYVDIAQSRTILTDVAQKQYRLVTDALVPKNLSGTLSDIFHISGPTPEQRLERTVEALRARVNVRESAKSGIITISTTAPSRELAEAINRNILSAVAEFNLSKRQTRASAERAFAADRLQGAQKELAAAEDDVQRFLASNRQYEGSPQLRLQFARLQRHVDLLQQVVTSLAQAYEQSRIDEVRNTPVFTVLDRPEGSSRVARSRRQIAVVGFVGGLLLAGMLAFGLERLRNVVEEDSRLYDDLGPAVAKATRFLLTRL